MSHAPIAGRTAHRSHGFAGFAQLPAYLL